LISFKLIVSLLGLLLNIVSLKYKNYEYAYTNYFRF